MEIIRLIIRQIILIFPFWVLGILAGAILIVYAANAIQQLEKNWARENSDNKLGGKKRATWILWNDTSNQAYICPDVYGNLELVGPAEEEKSSQDGMEDVNNGVNDSGKSSDTDKAVINP